jgi:hypothetical protein
VYHVQGWNGRGREWHVVNREWNAVKVSIFHSRTSTWMWWALAGANGIADQSRIMLLPLVQAAQQKGCTSAPPCCNFSQHDGDSSQGLCSSAVAQPNFALF